VNVKEDIDTLSALEELQSRIAILQDEVAKLTREKSDLETLVEMLNSYSDGVAENLLEEVETTRRESVERFEIMTNTVPVPIVVSRLSDDLIVYVNRAAGELSGVTQGKLNGRQIKNFYNDPSSRTAILAEVENQGYVNGWELQGRQENGSEFWSALSIRPLKFNGEPCLLEAYHDLTAQKRAQKLLAERTAELDRTNHILKQLDKTKSKFIDVAAHELRTPLTLMLGYAQLLKDYFNASQDPYIQQTVNGIITGAQRLHGIVNEMLDVSKLDNQLVQVFKAETRLSDLIEGLYKSLSDDIKSRELTLEVTGLAELPSIYADKELIYKVFYNLLVNAIKYTPNGGRIGIQGQVELHPEPYVEIVISDTGIGIDPLQHERIFDKFSAQGEVALHSSGRTKFKGGGPGLGLAIVRGIVLIHGGKIWVESPGHDETTCPGSRFYVQLPIGTKES